MVNENSMTVLTVAILHALNEKQRQRFRKTLQLMEGDEILGEKATALKAILDSISFTSTLEKVREVV